MQYVIASEMKWSEAIPPTHSNDDLVDNEIASSADVRRLPRNDIFVYTVNMKRLLIVFIFLSSIIYYLTSNNPVFAVDCTTERCSACDHCGYCWELTPTPPFRNPPSSWESCRNCLYNLPGVPAELNTTLKINDDQANPPVDVPPTPLPGRMYTQLGCLGTNLGGFQQEGAAAGVVQALLNVVFSIVGGVGFLTLIYASFIIMTSQSNPERMNYGKKMVVGAIVGIIFSLSSVFMINLLASGVLKIPGFSSSPSP